MINKSKVISGSILASAALLSVQSLAAQGKPQSQTKLASKQPNILFICIDDLRTQIGAYGHQYMVTPNLDKIAAQGRLFNNHYVQVPTSGASRAVLLTGYNPTQPRHTDNYWYTKALIGSREGAMPESFIHHLRRNGYYTVGMGKISHSPDGQTKHNGDYIAELPFSWDMFVNDPNTPWPKGDGILHAYADGVSRHDGSGYNPAMEFHDVQDGSYPDGVLANLATDQLEELANSDRPFFMAVGFMKPHLPFSAPKKYWDMYSDADVELSPIRDVPQGVDDLFLHNSNELFKLYTTQEKGGAGVVLSDEYSRSLRHGYYAALSYTDAQVGKVMQKLEELGLDRNTIVVVWGDHGWHLGDHTLWGKHSTFECALRSTFMVVTPDMESVGVPTDGLVATVDIYPTLCELAGIAVPQGLDGISFVPILENPMVRVRDEVLSYWNNVISIRNERYRMSLHSNPNGERVVLFDHSNDPYETKNVADSATDVVSELSRRIWELNNGFLKRASN